jgi:hypothetical protein
VVREGGTVISGRSTLRNLAIIVGVTFFVATVLQLLDQLNLIYQPPDIPESASLVDRVIAQIPYSQSVWPLFAVENGLFAVAFAVLVALGLALAARMSRADDRRPLLLWAFVLAGVMGTIGQLVLIGAVKASIDIPYCDCGFKNEEIVSQVWAEMVVQSAVQLLQDGAGVLAAVGLVMSALVFGRRAMPVGWTWLSYAAAIVVLVATVLGVADVLGDLTMWLTIVLTGILVPAWALWMGLAFRDHDEGVDEPLGVATGAAG